MTKAARSQRPRPRDEQHRPSFSRRRAQVPNLRGSLTTVTKSLQERTDTRFDKLGKGKGLTRKAAKLSSDFLKKYKGRTSIVTDTHMPGLVPSRQNRRNKSHRFSPGCSGTLSIQLNDGTDQLHRQQRQHQPLRPRIEDRRIRTRRGFSSRRIVHVDSRNSFFNFVELLYT